MHISDVSSPDVDDTFSTPPTSPFVPLPPLISLDHQIPQTQRPPLSRRASRPHTITIDHTQDSQPFQVDNGSPAVNLSSPSAIAHPPPMSQQESSSTVVASAVPAHIGGPGSSPRTGLALLPKSPCFVHSLLDKGISLTDWLRQSGGEHEDSLSTPPTVDPITTTKETQPRSLSSITSSPSPSEASSNSLGWIPSPTDYDDEEGGAASLTRQLAATAVGVREMSKQLGRARVKSNIQNVMIITKARDNRLITLTRDLALYLMAKPCHNGRGLVVYVDHQLRTSKRFDAAGIERDHPDYFRPTTRRYSSTSDFPALLDPGLEEQGQLRYWTSDMCSKSPHLFDFVVTLGGDGTVLFTSWLFQKIVPPVLPFALGSLGFLTNFDFADHRRVMDSVMESGIRVNLRMRFTCTVFRAVKPEDMKHGKRRRAVKKGDTGEIMMKNIEAGGWDSLEGNQNTAPHQKCKDKEIMCYTTRPVESFEVINDLVVDRGPSPYVSLLELFGDEHHMTTVQADGLTISTPTGSTAYSLSAGGSLVHPEIPAILITPICPHTLSFRPMMVPDSMELRVCVPYNSRSTAWASFDGRGRVELKQGDHIKITASKFPFPTVCADNQSKDWFNSISRTLKWNERERQKSFVVVEEGPEQPRKKRSKNRKTDATPNAADRAKMPPVPAPVAVAAKEEEDDDDEEDDEEDDDDEEEEEEEKFDIDDSSPEAAMAAAASSASIQDIPRDTTGSSSSPEDDSPVAPTAAQRAAAILTGGRINATPHHETSGSGIETPGRFGVPVPHPPKVHSRHLVGDVPHQHQHHYHNPHHIPPPPPLPALPQFIQSPQSDMRTPRPRDRVGAQTFSVAQGARSSVAPNSAGLLPPQTRKHLHSGHRRGRSMGDPTRRAAFAVYGHDESDSNTSDLE